MPRNQNSNSSKGIACKLTAKMARSNSNGVLFDMQQTAVY